MLSQHAPLATRFIYHLPGAPPAGERQSPDEAQLLAAARLGDAEAYGSLVRKYQDRLCCSLRHMCGTIEDAHDAAQEAFLRAYLKLDTFTGATLYQFSYDSLGHLAGVYDVNNNLTQIAHDANGNPTTITPPFAQPTTLAVDANGYLASVTDPAQQQTQFTYSSQGLMQTMVDARSDLPAAQRLI